MLSSEVHSFCALDLVLGLHISCYHLIFIFYSVISYFNCCVCVTADILSSLFSSLFQYFADWFKLIGVGRYVCLIVNVVHCASCIFN